jgi:hypothetical protein
LDNRTYEVDVKEIEGDDGDSVQRAAHKVLAGLLDPLEKSSNGWRKAVEPGYAGATREKASPRSRATRATSSVRETSRRMKQR